VPDRLVLAVFGPTASGKTAVAEALAERTGGEVVSADAMQAYRGVRLLTNQPVRPTRLVAIWPLEHEGSVGEYQRLAHAAVDELLEAARTPLVAGGTGLYLRAALGEIELPPAPRPGARERWAAFYDERGPAAAHTELARRDRAAAAAVHPHDRRRVVRALELAEVGRSLAPPQSRLWSGETRHPTFVVGLDVPRELLAARIDERTRAMFDSGVAEEAREALERPISATASKILGLREAAELPRDEAIDAIARRTRQYAAYQRKWMRRIPGLVTVGGDRPAGEVADEILELARARERVPARRAG
jgi:tRNA dimethylallyltransferase